MTDEEQGPQHHNIAALLGRMAAAWVFRMGMLVVCAVLMTAIVLPLWFLGREVSQTFGIIISVVPAVVVGSYVVIRAERRAQRWVWKQHG